MRIYNDIFTDLHKEHLTIQSFLSKFEKISHYLSSKKINDTQYFRNSLDFIRNYVGKYHHAKEEDILFPFVENLKMLKNGGPKCTLFYDMFMQSDYKNKVIAEHKKYSFKEYRPSQNVKKIIAAKSPLEIPLEDHESGYYLLESMYVECDKIDSYSKHDRAQLSKLSLWYQDMLHQHIRKEEECLFVALKQQFNPEQRAELNKRNTRFNSDHKDLLQQSLENLTNILRF